AHTGPEGHGRAPPPRPPSRPARAATSGAADTARAAAPVPESLRGRRARVRGAPGSARRAASLAAERCPMLRALMTAAIRDASLLRTLLALVCAFAFPPAAARAAITPDAASVVRHYLEVSGGAAAFAAESTTFTHAKLYAFGFEGEFWSWSARPNR